MNSLKKRRIFELVFVPAFTFLPSMMFSIRLFIKGTEHTAYKNLSASIIFAIIYQCLSLSLLYYVLHRRHENIKDLGVTFSWKNLSAGIILSVIAFLFTYLVQRLLLLILPVSYLHNLHPKNIDFIPLNFSWLFFVYILINPFVEELIVRGFIMREIYSLSNNKVFAITVSVLFQTCYHLYQGLLPAIILAAIFSIYSVFYVKTGKLLPVIIAHLIMDLSAFAVLMHRNS